LRVDDPASVLGESLGFDEDRAAGGVTGKGKDKGEKEEMNHGRHGKHGIGYGWRVLRADSGRRALLAATQCVCLLDTLEFLLVRITLERAVEEHCHIGEDAGGVGAVVGEDVGERPLSAAEWRRKARRVVVRAWRFMEAGFLMATRGSGGSFPGNGDRSAAACRSQGLARPASPGAVIGRMPW
jgi:hypothetical protein